MKLFNRRVPPPNMIVRIQHTEMEQVAIEGLWIGMYRGHYHLRAVNVVVAREGSSETVPYKVQEVMIPQGKVAFLEIIAQDESLTPSVG